MREVEFAADWLLDKLNTESVDNLIDIAKVLTGIWFARNKKVWEEKEIDSNIVMEMSSKHIMDWQEANKKNQMSRLHLNSEDARVVKWETPDCGWVKLNVDASVIEGDSSFAVGMIIRNKYGQFVMGRNLKVAGQASVLEAEAYGVLEALHWIQELHLKQVVIENDSSLVVQALQQHSEYFIEVGNILEASYGVMQQRNDLVIQHVKKHANRIAHNLARIPCLIGCYNLFISPPHCVLEILLSDYPSS